MVSSQHYDWHANVCVCVYVWLAHSYRRPLFSLFKTDDDRACVCMCALKNCSAEEESARVNNGWMTNKYEIIIKIAVYNTFSACLRQTAHHIPKCILQQQQQQQRWSHNGLFFLLSFVSPICLHCTISIAGFSPSLAHASVRIRLMKSTLPVGKWLFLIFVFTCLFSAFRATGNCKRIQWSRLYSLMTSAAQQNQ